MRLSTSASVFARNGRLMLILSKLLILSVIANAQSRPFSILYSANIKGTSTMFGNTLLNIVDNNKVSNAKMNSNAANGNGSYSNDNQNMQYTDIDGNTGPGSTTRNSSSADLILAPGTNKIKLARLYWGGRVGKDFDLRTEANKKIKLRKGAIGEYSDVTALVIDTIGISPNVTQYQAYADITAFIAAAGAGTYEVGNAPLSIGAVSNGGNNGGWGVVVVYENEAMNYNSIRLFDGFEQVMSDGIPHATSITLSGLNVPSGVVAAGDAKMGVIGWEGDANLTKDFLKINGHTFSNATNQPDNFWNGTISNNGVHVVTKTPSFTNQMGIDIDQFEVGVGYGIMSNDRSVTLEFGTNGDKYFPCLVAFTISMKDPIITVSKTVSDANGNNIAEKNEILTYTLTGSNKGIGNANFVEINDTLPSTVTYVPNSLKLVNSPGAEPGMITDMADGDVGAYSVNGSIKTVSFTLGQGSNGNSGGTIAFNESYEVQFQVTVNDPGVGKALPSVVNIARVKATSDASVEFVDDGTSIINPGTEPLPVSIPLPVTLISFAAESSNGNIVKITWSTSMEINCSKYIVERSWDGMFFTPVSTVACAGTGLPVNYYSAVDNVSSAGGTVAYYRLKQLDIDGKSNYSKVVGVKFNNTSQVNVLPNPFTSYFQVNVDWHKTEVITARVMSNDGREVISKNILVRKGPNSITMDALDKLAAGNYFLQLSSPGKRITRKISRQ